MVSKNVAGQRHDLRRAGVEKQEAPWWTAQGVGNEIDRLSSNRLPRLLPNSALVWVVGCEKLLHGREGTASR